MSQRRKLGEDNAVRELIDDRIKKKKTNKTHYRLQKKKPAYFTLYKIVLSTQMCKNNIPCLQGCKYGQEMEAGDPN